MQFTVVRNVGVSLLASAGVAGVVLGLAAQKSIGALLAGIQLSITQPIRIGDQLVVEGENGTVEEISLTYRGRANLGLPTADRPGHPVPGEALPELEQGRGGDARHGARPGGLDAPTWRRCAKELARILATEAKDIWDGKLAKLQVVDSTEQTMQVRVLLGGYVDTLFDLRCLVREKIMAYLHRDPSGCPSPAPSPVRRSPSRAAEGRGAPAARSPEPDQAACGGCLPARTRP